MLHIAMVSLEARVLRLSCSHKFCDRSAFLMQKSQVLHHVRNGRNLGILVIQKSDALPITDFRIW